MTELPKAYDHSKVEDAINKKWDDAKLFNPDSEAARTSPARKAAGKNAKPFSMVFPPANVTGVLHMGHGLVVSIEDILVRYHRMRGDDTLYIPGTDHAAIATQAKVEAQLYKKDGKTRRDFSREDFYKQVEDFALDSQKTILAQLKRLGASVDWSRLAYTLDEQREVAVRTAFKKLFDLGLIYRGERLVNWDPKLQTNVSDDEIEWKEEKTSFYYLKYGPFTIATARPETKFGDKYVVMHPDDKRYAKYKDGQKIELEWINGPITATVIKDKSIDMTFGTGVMTITPAHDAVDNDIAARHKLPVEPVIDLIGKLLPIAGEFAGLRIKKARPMIVEKLQAKGLIEKIDDKYVHRIATNSRGGGVIEPQIRKQWFIAVDKKFTLEKSNIKGIKSGAEITLKHLMRHVVESGQVKILPEYFDKTYYHWIDGLRDWCISRQIIFGHQIPVWYEGASAGAEAPVDSDKMQVGLTAPQGEWTQDPDTLDTWFSSGLWSFSTLGWPTKTADVERFHPLAVMETGYDILFFWVARMILMSGALLGEVPFKTVYLHGLVRDERRRKMSKSLGNVVNPLDVLDQYGTDALRFALVFTNAGGTDMAYSEERVRGMKHFGNKLWNISRFIMTNIEEDKRPALADKKVAAITDADKTILKQLETAETDVTRFIELYRFNEAAQAIYQFVWRELADKYLEASKPQLQDEKTADNTRAILMHCLQTSLKLLHPFMPFITEHIWGLLGNKTLIAGECWPAIK